MFRRLLNMRTQDPLLKLDKRDEEGHFLFITGKSYPDEVLILSIHVPNTRTPSFVKETLLRLKSYIKTHRLIL